MPPPTTTAPYFITIIMMCTHQRDRCRGTRRCRWAPTCWSGTRRPWWSPPATSVIALPTGTSSPVPAHWVVITYYLFFFGTLLLLLIIYLLVGSLESFGAQVTKLKAATLGDCPGVEELKQALSQASYKLVTLTHVRRIPEKPPRTPPLQLLIWWLPMCVGPRWGWCRWTRRREC